MIHFGICKAKVFKSLQKSDLALEGGVGEGVGGKRTDAPDWFFMNGTVFFSSYLLLPFIFSLF